MSGEAPLTSVRGEAPRIAVVDYAIGNLRSAEKAFQHLGADASLMADPDDVAGADGIVLPGVGDFGSCARALRKLGLDRAVLDAIAAGTPFLGVCVGFQLLYEGSDERPEVPGLGVFAGHVRCLPKGVKHPQMQWNILDRTADEPAGLLQGLDERPWVYFVHSYAPERTADTVATCDYGGPVTAAAERENVWGTQFHPEKSGRNGLGVLANFVSRCTEDQSCRPTGQVEAASP